MEFIQRKLSNKKKSVSTYFKTLSQYLKMSKEKANMKYLCDHYVTTDFRVYWYYITFPPLQHLQTIRVKFGFSAGWLREWGRDLSTVHKFLGINLLYISGKHKGLEAGNWDYVVPFFWSVRKILFLEEGPEFYFNSWSEKTIRRKHSKNILYFSLIWAKA